MKKLVSLNDRFHEFLRTYSGSEEIDKLRLTIDQQRKQKADFFLSNREAICEVKRIFEGPSAKIDDFVGKLQERDDWPIIMGASQPLSRVIRNFPDREEIEKKFNEKFSRSIEKSIQDANSQIRDTKETFFLPDASGILVFLNETTHLLTPKIVAHRISRSLLKVVPPNGGPRFPFVSEVLVIDMAHFQKEGEGVFSFPIFAIENPQAGNSKAREIANQLMQAWPRFDGFEARHAVWGGMEMEFFAAIQVP